MEQENINQRETNDFKITRPDFTGAGYAIWKNLDKNGKEYLSVMNEQTGRKVFCFAKKQEEQS